MMQITKILDGNMPPNENVEKPDFEFTTSAGLSLVK
jgi:hypothetical protein